MTGSKRFLFLNFVLNKQSKTNMNAEINTIEALSRVSFFIGILNIRLLGRGCKKRKEKVLVKKLKGRFGTKKSARHRQPIIQTI